MKINKGLCVLYREMLLFNLKMDKKMRLTARLPQDPGTVEQRREPTLRNPM